MGHGTSEASRNVRLRVKERGRSSSPPSSLPVWEEDGDSVLLRPHTATHGPASAFEALILAHVARRHHPPHARSWPPSRLCQSPPATRPVLSLLRPHRPLLSRLTYQPQLGPLHALPSLFPAPSALACTDRSTHSLSEAPYVMLGTLHL